MFFSILTGFAPVVIWAPCPLQVIGVLRCTKTSLASDFTCYFSWMSDFGFRALGERFTVFHIKCIFAPQIIPSIAIID